MNNLFSDKKIAHLKVIAKKYIIGSESAHNWEHTLRVERLSLKIAHAEGADEQVVQVAAILHDIGRGEEMKSKGRICHAIYGAKIAHKILAKYNLSDIFIEKVIHCIETHRFRSTLKPKSIEAKVLFDADKLDAIGAVGIGRAFLFAGAIGAYLHNPQIKVEKTSAYSKDDTAYREFLVKLRWIKDKMLTKTGKEIALDRHAFMIEFFDRLNMEVKGIL